MVPQHRSISASSQSRGITPCLPVFSPSALTPMASRQVASASSFDGCLRNPQLDGRPLGPPSRTFGVTPCYEGALESGVFFTADGGSIILGTPWPRDWEGHISGEVPCPSPHQWHFSSS